MVKNGIVVWAVVTMGLSGCSSSSDTCVDHADCFSGTVCLNGVCQSPSAIPEDSGSEIPDVSGGPSGRNNSDVGSDAAERDMRSEDGGMSPTADAGIRDAAASCVIEPFGHQCTDDEWEENDFMPHAKTVFGDSHSWCPNGELDVTPRSRPMTYCANDQGDAIRLLVQPQGNCAGSRTTVTLKITVEIESPCAADDISVIAYSTTHQRDICGESDVRCTTSEDGLTRTVEFLEDRANLWDAHVLIRANENIEFAYTVTGQVI